MYLCIVSSPRLRHNTSLSSHCSPPARLCSKLPGYNELGPLPVFMQARLEQIADECPAQGRSCAVSLESLPSYGVAVASLDRDEDHVPARQTREIQERAATEALDVLDVPVEPGVGEGSSTTVVVETITAVSPGGTSSLSYHSSLV
jgi:hypothetical protein